MSTRRFAQRASGSLLAFGTLLGCSSDGGGSSAPATFAPAPLVSAPGSVGALVVRIDPSLAGPARAALREVAGTDVELTLVKIGRDAEGDFVTMFENGAGPGRSYVFRNGELSAPQTEPAVSAASFPVDMFDPEIAAAFPSQLGGQLPAAVLVEATLGERAGLGVIWTVSLIGATGQPLEVLISTSGAIIGIETPS